MASYIKRACLLVFALFIFPVLVKAGSASVSLIGGSTTVGNNINVSIYLNQVDTKTLVSFGGYLNYDSSYLDLVSCSSNSRLSLTFNSTAKKFAFLDMTVAGITSGSIGGCTFKTKAAGTTSVSVTVPEGTNDEEELAVSVAPATINIKNPPSGNNNLASLSLDKASISFSSGVTSYNVSVNSDVTSINIAATAQDPNASISGTGSKTLDYGNNTFNIVVTAENGSQKTYTVVVNRVDSRSDNNNLASLRISSGSLSPRFIKRTTVYSVSVPFEVEKINVNASAEDSKAQVNISNPSLVAEKTTQVVIRVTAENGSTKAYTINVARGKDPNKKLSNNNYLESLTTDAGTLSPEFDKKVKKYTVSVPFEIKTIKFNAVVEDKEYATVKKDGNEQLTVGNNLIKFIVTAEDGSKRTYSVTVIRNKSTEDIKSTGTPYLQSIKSKNGIVLGSINKKKSTYGYLDLFKKISIKEALPEDNANIVNVKELDNSIVITVENEAGEKNYYVLVDKTGTYLTIISSIVASGGVGALSMHLINKKKSLFKKTKKISKNNTKK